MCIIAAQPKGAKTFERDTVWNMWVNNPHGAGYMYASEGQLRIHKPFFRLDDLWESYKENHLQFGHESPFVLHFRWATHGTRNKVNTHPHVVVPGKVGLVHNGILGCSTTIPKDRDISDTVWFIEQVLAGRDVDKLMSRRMRKKMAKWIGWGNKFVLLDHTGRMSIVNATMGESAMGCWFSNMDYEKNPFHSLDKYNICSAGTTNTGTTCTYRQDYDTRTQWMHDYGFLPVDGISDDEDDDFGWSNLTEQEKGVFHFDKDAFITYMTRIDADEDEDFQSWCNRKQLEHELKEMGWEDMHWATKFNT